MNQTLLDSGSDTDSQAEDEKSKNQNAAIHISRDQAKTYKKQFKQRQKIKDNLKN